MSNKKLTLSWIKELLSNNDPMGVTAISRQLDIPVATVQKYLRDSNELIQLDNKKWTVRPRLEELFDKDDQNWVKNASTEDLIKGHGLLVQSIAEKEIELEKLHRQKEHLYYLIQDNLKR